MYFQLFFLSLWGQKQIKDINRQRAMTDTNDIQTLQQQPEGQLFDRKSFRIDAKALGVILVAVAHRDYSILGTDIMVKIFDHHYVVESPGILPGLVRIDNIRQMHFSRNPKIAEFMREYKLVKEFGEGVDRMFREMAEAGNPAPEYKQVEFKSPNGSPKQNIVHCRL